MNNILWVATGGAIGATLRYLSSILIKNIYIPFPFLNTLLVNLLGCFTIGLLMNYLENKSVSEYFIKYFLVIGMLGAFTTYSAFSFEVIDLLNNKKFLISIIYIFLSVFGCLLFTFLGYNFNKF